MQNKIANVGNRQENQRTIIHQELSEREQKKMEKIKDRIEVFSPTEGNDLPDLRAD